MRVVERRPYRLRERITGWVRSEQCACVMLARYARGGLPLDGHARAGARGRHGRPLGSSFDRAGPFPALVLRLAVRDSRGRVARPRSVTA